MAIPAARTQTLPAAPVMQQTKQDWQACNVYMRDSTSVLSRALVTKYPDSLLARLARAAAASVTPYDTPGYINIRIDRSSRTFRVILDWLEGYEVFPLSVKDWEFSGLCEDKFLRFLISDADFLGLPGLSWIASTALTTFRESKAAAAAQAAMPANIRSEEALEHEQGMKLMSLKYDHAYKMARLEKEFEDKSEDKALGVAKECATRLFEKHAEGKLVSAA